MVAGGGADADILGESLERGCETYVTGNAATNCRLDFVQEQVRAFRELADEADVALVDAMHYGMEKPPQLAMVSWFRRPRLAGRVRSRRAEVGRALDGDSRSRSSRSRAEHRSSAETQRWSNASPSPRAGGPSPARASRRHGRPGAR